MSSIESGSGVREREGDWGDGLGGEGSEGKGREGGKEGGKEGSRCVELELTFSLFGLSFQSRC